MGIQPMPSPFLHFEQIAPVKAGNYLRSNGSLLANDSRRIHGLLLILMQGPIMNAPRQFN